MSERTSVPYHNIEQLQLGVRHEPHGLSYTKVSKNLFCAPKDSVKFVCPVEHLDHSAHATLGYTTSAKDLGYISTSRKSPQRQ